MRRRKYGRSHAHHHLVSNLDWDDRGKHQSTGANNQDAAGPVTVRTSKFITNRLLNRKQFVVTILHPTRANLSRDELSDKLAALYKTEKKRVVVFGLKTKFGGGSTQGFGLIYDDEESQKKFEPKYRLIRVSALSPLLPRIVLTYFSKD